MMLRHAAVLVALAVLFHPSIAGAWGNVFNGTPIGTGTNNQTNPAIVSDGAGGAIVFFEHLANNGSTDIYAQRMSPTGTQLWVNPTLVSAAMDDQSFPRAIADGVGGAIVVWQDDRQGGTIVADVFAQRIDANGVVLWANNGVSVSAAAQKQTNARITSDGSSGAIIAWSDFRDNTTYGVYTQRINATGTAQWTADGVVLGANIGAENTPAIASDGASGAIVAWHSDIDGDNDIYAQRINLSGVAQWPGGGISVCTAIGNQSYPQITPDGSGGAIVAWQDLRNTVTFIDENIYAQRINSSGAAQWAANGVVLCAQTGASVQPQIVSDGAAGAVVVWTDDRLLDYNLFAQRVNAAGAVLWTTDGAALSLGTSGQTGPAPVSDGAYGVIAAWNDTRSGNFDVYANRITGGGVIPTAVGDTPSIVKASLGQNHPNPFNPSTTIEYTLTARTPVKIEIFDARGALVASLDEGMREPGAHRAQWNASPTVSSGVYFYRLAGAPAAESRKMVLVK